MVYVETTAFLGIWNDCDRIWKGNFTKHWAEWFFGKYNTQPLTSSNGKYVLKFILSKPIGYFIYHQV